MQPLSGIKVIEAASFVTGPFAAMLLCGLSIAIKQVAFVEGAYFGLAFLWLLRRQGDSPANLALTAVAMVAIGLLPNLAGIAGYALAGPAALDDAPGDFCNCWMCLGTRRAHDPHTGRARRGCPCSICCRRMQ